MNKVVYSQESIFHLYRLGLVVAGKTGKRYHLQIEDELNSLILDSDQSTDPSIGIQFDAFVSALSPEIIARLESEGLIRPGRYLQQNIS
ncbi:MAG: hypothetical protein V3T17_10475 [Pseudomonadales bacterium]